MFALTNILFINVKNYRGLVLVISVKEAAERLSISERQVQKLCGEGAIKGASKISGVWLMPSESVYIGFDSNYAAVKQ